MEKSQNPRLSPEDLARCTEILEALASDSLALVQLSKEDRLRLFMAAGRVIHPEGAQIRRRLKALRSMKRQQLETKDRAVRASTTIRKARRDSVFVPPPRQIESQTHSGTPAKIELERPRDCYICKAEFTQVHFFTIRCARVAQP